MMPDAMPQAMPEHEAEHCNKESTLRNATLLTHASKTQDEESQVLNAAEAVDNGDSVRWVIRKRRFPWTGELAWRVTHPSLPRYFNHSFHLDSFEDAIGYIDDHTRLGAAS